MQARSFVDIQKSTANYTSIGEGLSVSSRIAGNRFSNLFWGNYKGMPVIVKESLPLGENPSNEAITARERFKHGMYIQANLDDNLSVGRVLTCVKKDGIIFLVMFPYSQDQETEGGISYEFRTLSTVLQKEPSLPERVSYIRALGKLIEYLREEGLVHFDLKPGNLILTDVGVLKLIDFDFVLEIKGEKNKGFEPYLYTGSIVYSSPERVAQKPIGEMDLYKSECFSFGLVVFEILFGEDLLNDLKTHEVIAAQEGFDLEDATRLETVKFKRIIEASRFKDKAALERIFKEILKKDPDKRIDVSDFMRKFDEWATNEVAE